MLSHKVPDEGELRPTYARRGLVRSISRYEMPEGPMDPTDAYQIVHDELALDGNPELNLATFVTTWMDDQAGRLMSESVNKNAIDWDEYPETVELQDRCVNMLARLYHAGGQHHSVGTATVGSSEAIHLAGLAMKWRWRKAREAAKKSAEHPNIVMGANVQVVWEKFARYFEVEPRYVPLTDTRYVIGVDEAMALVDENTIGVVAILGSTYTGQYEPVAALNDALEASPYDAPVHVDAASGGFVAPFLQPDLAWDFRLPRVRSINVSGHKYGLVYPGIGWVLWREQEDLPRDLIFTVDYLGGSHDNFGLNFSRGAAQIVAQYYNMIRLGKGGYRDVMVALADTAHGMAERVEDLGAFDLLARGEDLPVVCFRLAGGHPFSVFDISDHLRQRGWIVPAYKLAPDADDIAVLRLVVREGLSADMADQLVDDLGDAVDHLTHHPHATATRTPRGRRARGHVTPPPHKKTRGVC